MVACLQVVLQRLLQKALLEEPLGRPAEQLLPVDVRPAGQLAGEHVPEEPVTAVPAATELADEQVRATETLQDLPGPLDLQHRIAQRSGQALQDGASDQQIPLLFGQPGMTSAPK
jgi:hypothetical protein